MHVDVKDLRDFYARPLGILVRRRLGNRLRGHWTNLRGLNVVGLGFATPYLAQFREEAQAVTALMPGGQGALVWPRTGPVKTALVDEQALPLPAASVDRLLVVHSLEMVEGVRPFLREIWRVLRPEGRLLLVVPNRRSIWSRLDATPFGHGQPYNRGQIERLLDDAMFTPVGWSTALHMPPWEHPFLMRSVALWEKLGGAVAPAFAGVLLVEAQKELLSPISGGSKVRSTPRLVTVGNDALIMLDE